MPGKLYITATVIFFALATISISLDLAWLSTGAIPISVVSIFLSGNTLKLQSGPYYIFFIAGLLSDAMMIHRCYHLWSSRKSIIILPSLGLIGILLFWIVLLAINGDSDDVLFDAETTTFVYDVYGIVTLAENTALTGLMAGRIWWLDHRMKKTLIGAGISGNKPNFAWSLLGPILQSGVLSLIFFSIWVITTWVERSFQFLTPCALTQVVGISSTLIVVSIAINFGSDSQSRRSDEEDQPALDLENLELASYPNTGIMQDSVHRSSTDTIQPFVRKYEHLAQDTDIPTGYLTWTPNEKEALIQPLRSEHS
ncbi:hypothetical protein BDP27DRAFT_1453658 [Rhodocollybia butyracea]|uniref:Uncharacterized protein n=1 Tax=Rhodocollybia butyracea TaxID=206335 RepID=A0A9P5PAS3_9AGAR|nr:hypothetical protein BDP27DRAFT_1453658 [Rhodocollybia butyracea]